MLPSGNLGLHRSSLTRLTWKLSRLVLARAPSGTERARDALSRANLPPVEVKVRVTLVLEQESPTTSAKRAETAGGAGGPKRVTDSLATSKVHSAIRREKNNNNDEMRSNEANVNGR